MPGSPLHCLPGGEQQEKLVSIYIYLSMALLPGPATFFSEGMLLKDTVFFLPPPTFCTEGSCRNTAVDV